ncbi:MAG: hypothetical protein NC485_14645 [Ruminococcus flavefaciens]|nr:hypothetical protein [Ruminococcus flavefaciens]MCM1061841.1 hypothetical protein [Eubacterium sp.]
MKSFFNMVKSEYIKWLKGDKQIITAFSLICLYMYVLEPIKKYSVDLGEPVNVIEPFIIFLTNGFCIPIIIMTFTVLMIDFPDISGNSTFLLIRTGRTKWYKSQVIFVVVSAVSFIFLLLIFSILLMADSAFSANIWSNTERLINNAQYIQLRNQYPLSVLDLSVINNFSVIKATLYAIILTILYLVFTAQFQMTLSLRFNKMIGLCGNLLIIGLGLLSWAGDSKLKWLLPLSHSTIGWHYDELYNKTQFPIFLSLLYMIAINIFIYAAGKRVMQKKMLTLLNQGG